MRPWLVRSVSLVASGGPDGSAVTLYVDMSATSFIPAMWRCCEPPVTSAISSWSAV
jgi:hypothetical protein